MRRCVLLQRRGAGIVGLPNIGKSTLFNALTCSQQAKTGNFPFCTIDANLSKVAIYDERLRTLASFTKSQRIVDVELDLADVAGLIAGASKGAGLGNKFLNDIRPCTVVLHMVRCFESVKDGFDAPSPLEDISVIINELVLSDMDFMEKRYHKIKSRKASDGELVFTKKVLDWLSEGRPAKDLKLASVDERRWFAEFGLLSGKPMMYVLNVDDGSVKSGNAFSKVVENAFGVDQTVRVSANIEEQTSQFSREERLSFLREYDIDRPSGEVLMEKVFRNMLHMQSFFTVGPLMSHGWAIPAGSTSRQASGEIHGDFAEHFVKAKVMQWDKFVTHANLAHAEAMMDVVNEKYVMQDGDVMIVEHNAPRRK